MFRFSFVIISLILLACSEEIDLEIPQSENKPVVSCYLSSVLLGSVNDFLTVDLSESIDFLDTSDYQSVPDASVKIILNNLDTLSLEYDDSLQVYQYKNWINLSEGDICNLNIKTNTNSLYAIDTLPNKISIDNLTYTARSYYTENGTPISKLTITFTDDINYNNYYEIRLKSIDGIDEYKQITSDYLPITNESSYPSELYIGSKPPDHVLFNDNSFNGEEQNLNLYFQPFWEVISDSILNSVYTVEFKSVSYSYYQYRKTRLMQIYNQTVDLIYGTTEPFNVYTNIQGGYGIFGAYTSDNKTIVIVNEKLKE